MPVSVPTWEEFAALQARVAVLEGAPPPLPTNPTCDLSVSPGTITEGNSAMLSWTSTNGLSAALNGAGVALSGSQSVSPVGTTDYELVVTGGPGTTPATDEVTLTVVPALPPGEVPPPDNSPSFDTGHDVIPNFGRNPTIVSVASGLWSNVATWSPSRLPTASDVVAISGTTTVTYDILSNTAIKAVGVQAQGTLKFSLTANTRLIVETLQVLKDGVLEIGTEDTPVLGHVEVVIADALLDLTNDPDQFGHGIIVLGDFTACGTVKIPHDRVSVEPLAGHTMLTFASPVDWATGDKLVLPDTRQYHEDALRLETPAVASAVANVVTLTASLQYDHLGARNVGGTLEYLPVVGNVTRNVVLRSANPAGVRGHVIVAGHATAEISNVEFRSLGRTTNDPISGTNHVGRYPLHFHHLHHTFACVGCSIYDESSPTNCKWGITIHDSNDGIITDNVVCNVAGAGIVTEDGGESENLIEGNFVAGIVGTGRRGDDHLGAGNPNDRAREGGGFWLGGVDNYVNNNIVANCGESGFMVYGGDGGTPQTLGLRQFEGNEVFGNSRGLNFWFLGASYTGTFNVPESTVKDFVAWHCQQGIFNYPVHKLTFDGFVYRGDAELLRYDHIFSAGLSTSDYLCSTVAFKNSSIQGARYGLYVPDKVGQSTQTGSTPVLFSVSDTELANIVNIAAMTMSATTGGGAELSARRSEFHNIVCIPVPGRTCLNFQFYYKAAPQVPGNWIVPDEFYVMGFNGVQTDTFRLFWEQQVASFIVPVSEGWNVGAPVAGLTNQQAWSQHQIAIAGSVAPAGAIPRPDATGALYQ